MKHIQLEIIANEYQQEEIIALLDDFNPTGYEQTDEKLMAYFEEEGFNKNAVMRVLSGYDCTVNTVEEQNWNAVWEKNFQPVVVEDFCAVRAHFHEPIANVEHEIIITPKMSFGTGHHATTYMMMAQMRNIDFHNKSVFDFGTGTGILAILAEKLGAQSITAIDVDDWSIENAKENFERNHCNRITVTLSSQLPQEQFDIILANINRNVLLAYMNGLAKIIHKKGIVLLSGLLVADEADITKTAEEQGFQLLQKVEKNGWISLLLKSSDEPVLN
ncbi:MAG TPA: 50S ribosomal protein L11 methyltransferase [Flavisolibacter sp.]|jgi:ribosomal protein L11 methyltransferase|nr:50S ribosomal protein L11 methyltransferase [Flavisolibacter sp.]